MLKKSWPLLLLIGIGLSEPDCFQYSIIIKEPPSEIPGREDLISRLSFERLQTSDPKTGEIPKGIRQAELAFARTSQIKVSSRYEELRFESAGPFNVGGRTRGVAFDVRDENIILAGGVSGGIWKSTDGGQTWLRKTDPAELNSVTCLVQDTRQGKEDTWYYGTGEIVGNSARAEGAPFRGDGIYKSTDNGETWNAIPSTQGSEPNIFNSQFQYIWEIALNPDNLLEDELIVAAFGGILRSVDGGNTWEVTLGQELFNLSDTVDLNQVSASFYTSVSRGFNGVFYATLSTATGGDIDSPDAGIYASNDGVNWETLEILPEETQYRRIVSGHSKSDPSISYFLVDSGPSPQVVWHRLIRLEPVLMQEASERIIPNFGGDLGDFNTQRSYNMMIKVHPENADIVFIGGTNLYRSTDGFSTVDNMKWIGGYQPGGGVAVYPGHHPDQHHLLFYPGDPNQLLSANDGGLRFSADGTADSVIWESLNNGFITSQFYTIAQSKTANSSVLIGGMQDNGTDVLGSEGLNWKGVIGGDGAFVAVTEEDALWYASFQNGQVLRLTFDTDFNITSFGRVDPGGLVAESGSLPLFINPFILDPNNGNRMFYAGGAQLYFNPNVAQIPSGTQQATSLGWEVSYDNAALLSSISALEMSMDSKKLYFGTARGRLFRLDSADNQLFFSVEPITSPSFPENGYIASISVNPENAEHLIVVFSNYNIPSIFESTDAGDSFVDVSGNLEENPDGTGNGSSIRWVEMVPTNAGNLYVVGTSTGLYTTDELSADTQWSRQGSAIMGASVIHMLDYRMLDGKLAVATHGNGVFTTQIPDFKQVTDEKPEEDGFRLLDAYPNPFNEETTIRFEIPENGEVRVNIFSTKGDLITTVLWAPQFAGYNEITWRGTSLVGTSLTNGIYLYSVEFQGKVLAGRLLLRR